jgi:hypothetical protein
MAKLDIDKFHAELNDSEGNDFCEGGTYTNGRER